MSAPLKVGDRVKWICSHRHGKRFEVAGKIVAFKMTTFGGKVKKKGARVEVVKGSKYNKLTKRSCTMIAVDNLKRF